MSRGWESKSVEDQQRSREAANAADPPAPELTPQEQEAAADRQRRRHELELQRERILDEHTSSPHRRFALQNALADIEEKLAELGWSIHLNP